MTASPWSVNRDAAIASAVRIFGEVRICSACTGQQCRFAGGAATPDRADGVDDITGRQLETGSDASLTGWARGQLDGGHLEFGAGGGVDGAVDTAAAGER